MSTNRENDRTQVFFAPLANRIGKPAEAGWFCSSRFVI